MADQQIRYFEILPNPALDGSHKMDRVILLIITTDYLILIKPKNFLDCKRDSAWDFSLPIGLLRGNQDSILD